MTTFEVLDAQVRSLEREIIAALRNGTYQQVMTRELYRLRNRRDVAAAHV